MSIDREKSLILIAHFSTYMSLEHVFPPGDFWFVSDAEHEIFTDYSSMNY